MYSYCAIIVIGTNLNTLKTEEGADIDGYIKRINNGKANTEEDIAIEEIVERETETTKLKPIPVVHKEAV